MAEWLWRVTQAFSFLLFEGLLMYFVRKGSNPLLDIIIFAFFALLLVVGWPRGVDGGGLGGHERISARDSFLGPPACLHHLLRLAKALIYVEILFPTSCLCYFAAGKQLWLRRDKVHFLSPSLHTTSRRQATDSRTHCVVALCNWIYGDFQKH